MNGILYLSLVNGCVHRMAIKCVFVAAFDLKDKERERAKCEISEEDDKISYLNQFTLTSDGQCSAV